jgi:hypothetical protein
VSRIIFQRKGEEIKREYRKLHNNDLLNLHFNSNIVKGTDKVVRGSLCEMLTKFWLENLKEKSLEKPMPRWYHN